MKNFHLNRRNHLVTGFKLYAAYFTSISVFLQKCFLDHFAEFYIHLGAMPIYVMGVSTGEVEVFADDSIDFPVNPLTEQFNLPFTVSEI
jgi:hypothetical protein